MPTAFECGFFFDKFGYVGDVSEECSLQEEDEEGRTEIIQSVSEIGDMVDFLKVNPYITLEQYKWEINPAMVKIMQVDNTHVRYLSEKESKNRKSKKVTGENLMDDLGMSILG